MKIILKKKPKGVKYMYKKIYKSPISNIILTRTNNNLISYGGGIKNKIKFLEIEGNNIK